MPMTQPASLSRSLLSGQRRDALTGLIDGAAFEALLAARLHDTPEDAGVALIELKGLARFNDFRDRAAGDAVLVALARRIERLARDDLGPQLHMARLTGARFALLAPRGTPITRLRLLARGIVAAAHDVLAVPDGEQLSLRLAVGLVAADSAPAQGLARIGRRLGAPPSLVRALDVEAALTGSDLIVCFQPQFDLIDDRLIGAEALVRWNHPRLGEVGGATLFAAASATGLERAMSLAVWTRALDAMARWPAALTGLRIALNATAADLADPAMPDELLDMAKQRGIGGERLTVEVTETALIERMDAAIAALDRLRAAGVATALDDFGTGYSGLAWLKQMPVDYIKIDGALARDAAGAPREQTVVRGIIALAHALGIDVLAEGVEDEGQRQLLADFGCRWYQGFLRAPALPDDAFVALAVASV